jgi:hypothetical protein
METLMETLMVGIGAIQLAMILGVNESLTITK